MIADKILFNGEISTQDPANPRASAVAISGTRFIYVGDDKEVMKYRDAKTQVIDLQKGCVIPGLIDTHTHAIRQGNNFAMELRWDGVPSLADGLNMIRKQASSAQFAEKRLPTLAEINAVAPDVPVYVLHLYDRAWLNQAALRALNIDEHYYETWVSGRLERDDNGVPTGLALARPNAFPLYALLDMAPKLSEEDQLASTRACSSITRMITAFYRRFTSRIS